MKTIGILGGLGPQATMDFEARLHRVCQKLIPQKINFGYPPTLVYYFRFAPILLDDKHLPVLPMKIDPRLYEAAAKFRGQVDFLVIPSNTPHLFAAEIEKAAGCPLLSMIETAINEVERRGLKRAGVVGFGEPTVYTDQLKARGIEFETLASDPTLRKEIDDAIRGVMEGKLTPEGTALVQRGIDAVTSRNVEATILGCTELPLLLGARADDNPSFINPPQLLAERAVRAAIG